MIKEQIREIIKEIIKKFIWEYIKVVLNKNGFTEIQIIMAEYFYNMLCETLFSLIEYYIVPRIERLLFKFKLCIKEYIKDIKERLWY